MAFSSTTKHVVIDWSSSPIHSFVQLGPTPTLQKDSNDYVQDFEQEVILTTKDILNINIDDIFSLSSSTATAHQPRRKNFPFFVSFKKTHVIKTQYTGFNKIYNSGRSKSFFFEMVDRNPGTNDIHLKIHTNDYLMSTIPISFNSTSKRYRFHFGIYVPCGHHIVQKASLPPTLCQLPSAIILSNNRHGCGSHVKKIFQDITLKNDQLSLNQEKNTKAFHANLTFKRWQNLEWKDVYFKYTGIFYRSHLTILTDKKNTRDPRTHVYNKLIKGFNYHPSPNTKVAKKQQCHFERNCHRVLKKEVVKPGGTSNTASKLGAAKASNFLFLPSQTINKRIWHIRNKHIKCYPDNSDLNFSTPHDRKYKKRSKSPEQRRMSTLSTETTIEPQVVVSPTMTDAEWELAVTTDCDKFHKDRTEFVKQHDRIVRKYSNFNPPNDGQSKKKLKLTLEDEMRTLYARLPGLIIPNNRKQRQINKYFPLKRWVNINPNISIPLNNPKWSCLDTNTTFDSEQAGPSSF
ncbi:hypothetical protein C1646_767724 [Rhizophagus diaphanus]|nr:hypothetical protein C1646_767724 [Rhizophagus diaphanus] [Rhizophagus sp. MUCL 43196]